MNMHSFIGMTAEHLVQAYERLEEGDTVHLFEIDSEFQSYGTRSMESKEAQKYRAFLKTVAGSVSYNDQGTPVTLEFENILENLDNKKADLSAKVSTKELEDYIAFLDQNSPPNNTQQMTVPSVTPETLTHLRDVLKDRFKNSKMNDPEFNAYYSKILDRMGRELLDIVQVYAQLGKVSEEEKYLVADKDLRRALHSCLSLQLEKSPVVKERLKEHWGVTTNVEGKTVKWRDISESNAWQKTKSDIVHENTTGNPWQKNAQSKPASNIKNKRKEKRVTFSKLPVEQKELPPDSRIEIAIIGMSLPDLFRAVKIHNENRSVFIAKNKGNFSDKTEANLTPEERDLLFQSLRQAVQRFPTPEPGSKLKDLYDEESSIMSRFLGSIRQEGSKDKLYGELKKGKAKLLKCLQSKGYPEEMAKRTASIVILYDKLTREKNLSVKDVQEALYLSLKARQLFPRKGEAVVVAQKGDYSGNEGLYNINEKRMDHEGKNYTQNVRSLKCLDINKELGIEKTKESKKLDEKKTGSSLESRLNKLAENPPSETAPLRSKSRKPVVFIDMSITSLSEALKKHRDGLPVALFSKGTGVDDHTIISIAPRLKRFVMKELEEELGRLLSEHPIKEKLDRIIWEMKAKKGAYDISALSDILKELPFDRNSNLHIEKMIKNITLMLALPVVDGAPRIKKETLKSVLRECLESKRIKVGGRPKPEVQVLNERDFTIDEESKSISWKIKSREKTLGYEYIFSRRNLLKSQNHLREPISGAPSVIIGMGPAGLRTALGLLEKGIDVLICDKRTSFSRPMMVALAASTKKDYRALCMQHIARLKEHSGSSKFDSVIALLDKMMKAPLQEVSIERKKKDAKDFYNYVVKNREAFMSDYKLEDRGVYDIIRLVAAMQDNVGTGVPISDIQKALYACLVIKKRTKKEAEPALTIKMGVKASVSIQSNTLSLEESDRRGAKKYKFKDIIIAEGGQRQITKALSRELPEDQRPEILSSDMVHRQLPYAAANFVVSEELKEAMRELSSHPTLEDRSHLERLHQCGWDKGYHPEFYLWPGAGTEQFYFMGEIPSDLLPEVEKGNSTSGKQVAILKYILNIVNVKLKTVHVNSKRTKEAPQLDIATISSQLNNLNRSDPSLETKVSPFNMTQSHLSKSSSGLPSKRDIVYLGDALMGPNPHFAEGVNRANSMANTLVECAEKNKPFNALKYQAAYESEINKSRRRYLKNPSGYNSSSKVKGLEIFKKLISNMKPVIEFSMRLEASDIPNDIVNQLKHYREKTESDSMSLDELTSILDISDKICENLHNYIVKNSTVPSKFSIVELSAKEKKRWKESPSGMSESDVRLSKITKQLWKAQQGTFFARDQLFDKEYNGRDTRGYTPLQQHVQENETPLQQPVVQENEFPSDRKRRLEALWGLKNPRRPSK